MVVASTLSRKQLLQRLNDLEQIEVERARLLHELQVHKIELENQNETLREAQRALQDSRDRLADLFDFAPVGYLVVTAGGTVVEVNLTAAELLGVPRAGLVGTPLFRLFARADAERLYLLLRQALRDPVAASGTLELRLEGEAEPRILHLDCRAEGADPEAANRVRIAVGDVTARERARDALARKTLELEALLDTIPAPVYFKDPELRLVAANRAFLALVGLPLEGVIGRRAAEVFPDDMARWFEAGDRELFDTGRNLVGIEQGLRDPQGGPRWYSTYKTPLRSHGGEILGLVGLSVDVTERKHTEEQRLAQLSSQRDALVRDVHHRIKNHLQGVTGLLRMRAQQHPDIASLLEEAIGQIRTIAQVYALQTARAASRASVRALVEAAARATEASASLSMEPWPVPCQASFVSGENAVPLALVLNELITNAHKHLDEPPREGSVRIAMLTQADRVRIRVANGPARLPPGFDFAHRDGLGTGLDLVGALLPSEGACLVIRQSGEEVVAELDIGPPLVEFGDWE